MDDPYQRPAIVPSVFYKDPRAALDWLAKAFGFRRTMVIRDAQGRIAHAEMRLGDGVVYVGGEWSDFAVSAASVEGRNTQTVHVHLQAGLDAHCEQARLAGAVILVVLPEYLRFLADWRFAAFGALLIGMLLVRRQGLLDRALLRLVLPKSRASA